MRLSPCLTNRASVLQATRILSIFSVARASCWMIGIRPSPLASTPSTSIRRRAAITFGSAEPMERKQTEAGVFSAAGLAKKVRTSFERAVQLDPNSSEARTDLGEFYTEAPGIMGGGKDKARLQADALMAFDPARGHWLLARIAEKNKDAAGAEHEYRSAIEASRSGARAWLDLANFFFYAHRFDEMEKAIHSLESAPVDHPESLMHAAGILLRANREYPTAVRLTRRYLESPVEEGPAFKAREQLGQLLEKQGDRRGAAEEYRAALALAHNYSRAQEDLKRVDH